MRLHHITLAESAATIASPAFKRWFKGSVVTDPRGRPLRVFHGREGDRSGFHPLMHFGSLDTAHDRLRHLAGNSEWATKKQKDHYSALLRDHGGHEAFNWGAQVIPTYLRITKPLELDDDPVNLMTEVPFRFSQRFIDEVVFLHEAGVAPAEIRSILKASDLGAATAQKLASLGYDGVVFPNIVEGPKTDTWVIFRPDQVWTGQQPTA